MGNINFRDESWFIDDQDEITHNDEVEVRQEDNTWLRVTIIKSHPDVFHFSPNGLCLTRDMTIRRITDNAL